MTAPRNRRRGALAALAVALLAALVAWWMIGAGGGAVGGADGTPVGVSPDGAVPSAGTSAMPGPPASTAQPRKRAASVDAVRAAWVPEVAEPPAPEVLETRVLVVKDADGRPVPGALLDFNRRKVRTDFRGRWTWTRRRGEPAWDSKVSLLQASGYVDVTLEGPETPADLGRLPLLDVVVMDPLTGATRPADAAIVRFDDSEPLWCEPASGIPIPIQRDEGRVRIEAAPVLGGDMACASVTETVSIGDAHGGVRAVAVAWPAHTARVRAVDAEGRPLPGASVQSIRLDDHAPDGRIEVRALPSDSAGFVELAGVPAIPGSTAWVQLVAAGPPRLKGRALLELSADAPAAVASEWSPDVGLGGGASGASSRRAGETGGGRLRVRVRREDGSPAAGARVALGRFAPHYAGADGVATFESVAGDRVTLSVGGPGFALTRVRAAVPESREIEVTERPARVRVAVVDDLGRPVCGAAVRVRGRGVAVAAAADGADLLEPTGNEREPLWHGTVLDLAPRTDMNGRIELRVHRGTMDIEAWRGSIVATAEITSWPEPESDVVIRLAR